MRAARSSMLHLPLFQVASGVRGPSFLKADRYLLYKNQIKSAWFHHRLSAFFSLLDAPPSWTRHPRRTAHDVPRALSDAPPPSCRCSVALHYRRRPAVARISTIAHLCAPLSRTTYAGRDSLRVFLLFTLPHWHHCRRADSRRHPDCFRHLIVACSRCSVVLNDATGRKHRLRSSARMDIHPRDSET